MRNLSILPHPWGARAGRADKNPLGESCFGVPAFAFGIDVPCSSLDLSLGRPQVNLVSDTIRKCFESEFPQGDFLDICADAQVQIRP